MKKFRFVFLASFCFSVHLALLAYLNSTMLSRFGGTGLVGAAFTIGSALSFVLLFLAPRAVRHVGLVRSTVITLLVSSFLLFTLGNTTGSFAAVSLFVMYFSLNTVAVYLFDLFVEHYSQIETTGVTRGTFLTLNNIGWMGAPVIAGMISAHFGFGTVYLVGGAIVLTTLLIVAISQRGFVDRPYERKDFRASFKQLLVLPKVRRIVTLNLILQFFFAWMVVYSPAYLQAAGFDWKAIGGILSIMLVPFVVFEYPVGKLADMIGETRLIRLGLLIAGGATIWFGYATGHSFWLYAGILFLTRTGASIIEVCCDSYFFRQVTERDASLVSLYRAMIPIAYIIGPLSGALVLSIFSYKIFFSVLAGLLFIAAIYSGRLARNY